MTHEYYQMESKRLREVLKDALDRGDYNLEMDVKEMLQNLQDKFNNNDE